MEKILKILNLHPDENQKWLLLSTFFSGLLITFISPSVIKVTVAQLPTQFLAFNSLALSVSGLLVGMIWKGKIRKYAVKYFLWLAISESTLGFLLGMYLCFIDFNVWIYAICSLIYSSLITTFVGKCIMVFKSKMWNNEKRELYDNNLSIVSGIVCVLGFGLAMCIVPSIQVAMFIWGLCCIIDDIGWIYVYSKNYNTLHECDEIEN